MSLYSIWWYNLRFLTDTRFYVQIILLQNFKPDNDDYIWLRAATPPRLENYLYYIWNIEVYISKNSESKSVLIHPPLEPEYENSAIKKPDLTATENSKAAI